MGRPVSKALRVLVLAPIGQDGRLVCRALNGQGIAAVECRDALDLAEQLDEDVGAVLLTEETADDSTMHRLAEALERQSPWLDLPILVCGTASLLGGWPPQMDRLRHLGNVTFLERPIRTAALISAIRTALRSRQRQLRLKLLAEMTDSLVAENDPEKLLADVWRVLRGHLAVDRYLYHVVDTSSVLRLAAYNGVSHQAVVRLSKLGRGDWDASAKKGLSPSLCAAAGLDTAQSFPLVVGENCFGTLTFAMEPGRNPAPDERALLRTVCDHLALALMRSRTLAELQQRADELVESARRKDEFLAMLGHELRNPLATLSMGVELLKQLVPDPAPGGLPLDVVTKEVRHITRLVDDLLDVSRITRGKIELHKTMVDFGEVVAEAVEKVRPQAEERRHQLNIEAAPGQLMLYADRTRIRQVVENLVTNAVKYTDTGGVVTVSTGRAGDQLELRVQDTGIGLTAEMREQIFVPFVQDGRGLDRSQGGLGVGLALVQRLVEMHGGEVKAFSEGPGHGSAFHVKLPLAQQAEPENAVPVVRESADPAPHLEEIAPLRVLIVEDIPSVGRLAQMLLEKLGHEVRLVDRGQQALPVCQSFHPHLAILDIGLPDMDGYRVARQLREQLGSACPMLVALTGYGQREDRRRAAEAGFDQHLTKPADVDAFRRVLRMAAARGDSTRAP